MVTSWLGRPLHYWRWPRVSKDCGLPCLSTPDASHLAVEVAVEVAINVTVELKVEVAVEVAVAIDVAVEVDVVVERAVANNMASLPRAASQLDH